MINLLREALRVQGEELSDIQQGIRDLARSHGGSQRRGKGSAPAIPPAPPAHHHQEDPHVEVDGAKGGQVKPEE